MATPTQTSPAPKAPAPAQTPKAPSQAAPSSVGQGGQTQAAQGGPTPVTVVTEVKYGANNNPADRGTQPGGSDQQPRGHASEPNQQTATQQEASKGIFSKLLEVAGKVVDAVVEVFTGKAPPGSANRDNAVQQDSPRPPMQGESRGPQSPAAQSKGLSFDPSTLEKIAQIKADVTGAGIGGVAVGKASPSTAIAADMHRKGPDTPHL